MFSTKQRLNNSRFSQQTTDILNLSGTTNITGLLRLTAPITGNTQAVNKEYVSNLVTTANTHSVSGGLTKIGNSFKWGGSLSGNTFLNGAYQVRFGNTSPLTYYSISSGGGFDIVGLGTSATTRSTVTTKGQDLRLESTRAVSSGTTIQLDLKYQNSVQIIHTTNDENTSIRRALLLQRGPTTGSGSVGMGVGIGFSLKNGSGTYKETSGITYSWTDATASSEDAKYGFNLPVNSVDTKIVELDRYGWRYQGNYSSNYTTLSLPHLGYVTGLTSAITGNNGLNRNVNTIELGGTLSKHTLISGNNGVNSLHIGGSGNTNTRLFRANIYASDYIYQEASNGATSLFLNDGTTTSKANGFVFNTTGNSAIMKVAASGVTLHTLTETPTSKIMYFNPTTKRVSYGDVSTATNSFGNGIGNVNGRIGIGGTNITGTTNLNYFNNRLNFSSIGLQIENFDKQYDDYIDVIGSPALIYDPTGGGDIIATVQGIPVGGAKLFLYSITDAGYASDTTTTLDSIKTVDALIDNNDYYLNLFSNFAPNLKILCVLVSNNFSTYKNASFGIVDSDAVNLTDYVNVGDYEYFSQIDLINTKPNIADAILTNSSDILPSSFLTTAILNFNLRVDQALIITGSTAQYKNDVSSSILDNSLIHKKYLDSRFKYILNLDESFYGFDDSLVAGGKAYISMTSPATSTGRINIVAGSLPSEIPSFGEISIRTKEHEIVMEDNNPVISLRPFESINVEPVNPSDLPILSFNSPTQAIQLPIINDIITNVVTPLNGMIAYDSSDNVFRGRAAGQWVVIGATSGFTGSTGSISAINGLNYTNGTIRLGGGLTGDTFITGFHDLNLGSYDSPLNYLNVNSNSFSQNSNQLYLNTPLSGGTIYSTIAGSSAGLYLTHANGSAVSTLDMYTEAPDTTITKLYSNGINGSTTMFFGGSDNHISIESTNSGFAGITYDQDFSSNYTPLSIPHVGFVTGLTSNGFRSQLLTDNVYISGNSKSIRFGSSNSKLARFNIYTTGTTAFNGGNTSLQLSQNSFRITGLTAGSTSNLLYYNATTGAVTYGSGGGTSTNIITFTGTSRNITAADDESIIYCTSNSNVTLNLTGNTNQDIQVMVIKEGNGNIAFTSSGTIRSVDNSYVVTEKYAGATVIHKGSNTWSLLGLTSGGTGFSGSTDSTVINNNANDRLITGTASGNTLNAEANLTWNGALFTARGVDATFSLRNSTDTRRYDILNHDTNNGLFIRNQTLTTNTKVIIGAATSVVPNATLHIRGGSVLTGNTLVLENSTGSTIMRVLDNGKTNHTMSHVSSAGLADGAFTITNITGTDSAGREILTLIKKWNGAGTPDSNNQGVLGMYLPDQSLSDKYAIGLYWGMSGGLGSENSNFVIQGLVNGTTNNFMRVGGGLFHIGQGSQSVGTGDTAVGIEAKTNNNQGTSLGYQAGSTSGTFGAGAISIGNTANQGSHNIGIDSISIGRGSKTSANGAYAIGNTLNNNVANSFGLGWSSTTSEILLAKTANNYFNVSGNFAFWSGATTAYNSMTRGFFIGAAGSAPSGNPVGGAYWWVDPSTYLPKWRTPAGVVYTLSDTTSGSTGGLDVGAFNAYSASTLTNINSRLLISNFNSYSGTTNTAINSKVSTSVFNSYSATTNTTKADKLAVRKIVGSAYTLVSGDNNYIIEVTGSTNSTITINNGLPDGFQISINNKMAANTVTLAGTATRQLTGSVLATQYAGCSLYIFSNVVAGFGNLT